MTTAITWARLFFNLALLLLSSAAEHLQAQHHPAPPASSASLAAVQYFVESQALLIGSAEGGEAVQSACWQSHLCCYVTAAAAGFALLRAAGVALLRAAGVALLRAAVDLATCLFIPWSWLLYGVQLPVKAWCYLVQRQHGDGTVKERLQHGVPARCLRSPCTVLARSSSCTVRVR